MEKLRLEVLLAGVDKLSGPLRRVLGGLSRHRCRRHNRHRCNQ